jgi:acetolactate synthase-1/2/3 large subunit
VVRDLFRLHKNETSRCEFSDNVIFACLEDIFPGHFALMQKRKESGASLLLRNLKRLGIDRIFIVSGTDYGAIIEEKAKGIGPEFVVVPHELTAASAALGYSFGEKLGVVAVHTLPGTANALGVIMNAYGSRIPLLVLAGRTPYTETGSPASRSGEIHWTQEALDQGEMLRQWTKLDFEIRRAEQIPNALSRAVQLATSEPSGPVYLSFPREVTVEMAENVHSTKARFEPGPTIESIRLAAKMVNDSSNPVIIAWRAGRRRAWFNSLRNFVDLVNIPVLNYAGEVLNYPSRGRMAVDTFELSKTDLVMVVESEVPWIPKKVEVNAKVIKVDTDPAYQYIPYYGFPADLAVLSCVDHFFDALASKVKPRDAEIILKLRKEQADRKNTEIRQWSKARNKIHPRYLSYEIGKLNMPVLNEYTFNPKYAEFEEYGSYFGNLSAGYLGWTLGAAVGLRMATGCNPISTVGDGAFFFGVPESFYYLAHDNPVMVVIFDNGGWLASCRSVIDIFPKGVAAMKKQFPGTEFKRYNIGATVKAFDGYFELIEKPSEIQEALHRGRAELTRRKKIVVLQFIVERTR